MKKQNRGAIGILVAVGAFLLSKMKWLLVIFKLAKFSTVLSMLLSLGAYALVYGWKFGTALVYLLFVHEMGHLWAAKRIGLKTSPAIFIPFMGAVIGLKEMPKNAKDEAFVAYMGPLFGLLSFVPAIPLYIWTKEPFWLLVIVLGGIINFFNLIPSSPLDGGRIVSAVSTKIWAIGLMILLVYSIINITFFGFFLFIIGCTEWYRVYKRKKEAESLGEEINKHQYYSLQLQKSWEEHASLYQTVSQMRLKLAQINEKERQFSLTKEDKREQKALQFQIRKLDEINMEVSAEEPEEALAERKLQAIEEKIKELQQEKRELEQYYHIDTKARITVFILYLALLLVLGYSAYYGYTTLETHPELLPSYNE
jgi:Zn-dependent protease